MASAWRGSFFLSRDDVGEWTRRSDPAKSTNVSLAHHPRFDDDDDAIVVVAWATTAAAGDALSRGVNVTCKVQMAWERLEACCNDDDVVVRRREACRNKAKACPKLVTGTAVNPSTTTLGCA